MTRRLIDIPDDMRACRLTHVHFLWIPTDTSDKYEDEYELVRHHICLCCGSLRHTLCLADGRRIGTNALRYEHPEGYLEITVTSEARTTYAVEQWESAREQWRKKKTSLRPRTSEWVAPR